MKNSLKSLAKWSVIVLWLSAISAALAQEVVITTKIEMQPEKEVRLFFDRSTPATPEHQYGSREGALLKKAVEAHAKSHSTDGAASLYGTAFATQRIRLNSAFYTTMPAMYMPQTYSGEKCTTYIHKKPNGDFDEETVRRQYECVEGQTHREICHLYFLNDAREIVALHGFKIEMQPEHKGEAFCNGIVALGVGDRDKGLLLATVRYFGTGDRKAKSREEIGLGWSQATYVLRIQEDKGKITLTQDDSCLGNPNTYTTIAAARKAFKQCQAQQ